MSNNCRDCNRFQTPPTSTAPDRPAIQPPTMYDHFPNFQKFQQFKEEKAKFEVEQRELAEANKSNFTDFRVEVETISENVLSDFASYRQQSHNAELVNGAGNSSNLNEFPRTEDKDVSAALKPTEKNTSLLTNSTPVICPISECNRLQDVKSILSHYLQDHSQVEWREIFLGKSSKLLFDPDAMDYGENICFGVLAYGGNANDSSSRPAERGICKNNSFFSESYRKIKSHLPIIIMACRTSWTTQMSGNSLDKKFPAKPDNPSLELLIIWLATVPTTKPIHCTIRVYDKLMKSSRGVSMRVRCLNESQNPSEFMLKDTNYLRLSNGEINILSQNRTEDIKMEILINEYE